MDDPAPHPAILASDQDRDRSIEQLSTAVSEGRLPLEEFADRVGLAQTARTQDDLAALTRDLPAHTAERAVVAAPGRHLAFCSTLVRRGPFELEPRTSFRCIAGTVVLDLSEARLSGSETDLEIHNLFGTVTVIVPDGVQVSVSGGGLFGSEVIASAHEHPQRTAAPDQRARSGRDPVRP